jgi:hypothetical protein
MPSINKPLLFALRCITVIICCLPFVPARTGLAVAQGALIIVSATEEAPTET